MPDIATAPSIADPNIQADPPGSSAASAAATSTAAVSQPTESWSKGFFADDGTLNHKVFEKAPDDLKPLGKALERYKTAEDYFKGQRERDSLLGKKGLIDPPGEKATPEEKAEYSAHLRKINGAPDKPEGYGIVKPENIPAEQWNQAFADSIQKIAYEEAISPAALQKLAAAQVAQSLQDQEATKVAEAQWFDKQDKLFREVTGKEGLEFGKANEFAEKAGKRFGIDPKNPAFQNASVKLALARIGQLMGEDKLVTGETRDLGVQANMSSKQAETTYISIMREKSNPDYEAYWNKDKKIDPARVEQVRNRVAALQRVAHPA